MKIKHYASAYFVDSTFSIKFTAKLPKQTVKRKSLQI